MAATVLYPLQGDTVTNPVTVSFGYDTAAGALNVTSNLGGVDNVKAVVIPPTSGALGSDPITSPVGYPKTVTVTPNDGTPGDTQNNITVQSNGNPPPITVSIDRELRQGVGDQMIKLSGTVAAAATLYVVAQVIEVNLQNQTRTAVALGIDAVKNNLKWKINLTYPTVNGRQYVLRLFGLDVNLNRSNSVTGPIA